MGIKVGIIMIPQEEQSMEMRYHLDLKVMESIEMQQCIQPKRVGI